MLKRACMLKVVDEVDVSKCREAAYSVELAICMSCFRLAELHPVTGTGCRS